MAITHRDRVGKTLDLLRAGMFPFVQREFEHTSPSGQALTRARSYFHGNQHDNVARPFRDWDIAALLNLMAWAWNDVFRQTLGRTERSLVGELLDWRNKWAHQERISGDDAERALDSAARLLTAISAAQADEVARMRDDLRRHMIDEQTRNKRQTLGGSLIATEVAASLKPWREVATPHPDVASGRYQQAEFAADLWQVQLGEGSDEYRDAREFFRRTFLTESLTRLLVGGARRLTDGGGDPVVQLQTNFGGGKTHSMLALYHLCSGTPPSELDGVDAIMAEAGQTELPSVRRAVLVGNKIDPGSPVTKPDGTVVRTLWGELAYQLGGAEAYARVAQADERATNPGDKLRELFNDYGPCLILIDEWVAYARQLHEESDLPGGSFETQFTFAQALTESARAARNCLLLISLPASDTDSSASGRSEDVEVGGIRGREALDRLGNVIGRMESSWRPATAEEGFEIVRRRLFEPLAGDAFKQRDLTARAFSDLYGEKLNRAEFPSECIDRDYERRIQSAYPIHPELFDRLYTDWSTLVKFQRTRGVLRLMASVIHSLWEGGDRNLLIMPSTIPINDKHVQSELTRYLDDHWAPIIESDVDGPNSLPLKIDNEVANLGKLQAARRAARTIYLGSAPTASATNRGIEERRVKLGCVMPGERPQHFSDAIRRLAQDARYLYQDGSRYWYSTRPTVTKLAADRALELERDPDRMHAELDRRLKSELGLQQPRDERRRSGFARVHLAPRDGGEVADERETRLVVLDAEHPYQKVDGNAAETVARSILESRGVGPRIYRNTLVFLAADQNALPDLEDALRRYLAWDSIVAEQNELNLDPHQVRQAKTQRASANSVVTARLPETYRWVLSPKQSKPSAPIEWQAMRLSGDKPLAERASAKLRKEEGLIATLGGVLVRKELDEVPLWRGDDHVPIRTLVDDFAQQLYLPRLVEPSVLTDALRDGIAHLISETETFAYAESFNEDEGRYLGLRARKQVAVSPDDLGLIVRPDVAKRQLEIDERIDEDDEPGGPGPPSPPPSGPKRYHGSVEIDASRVGRDAGKIAQEVIAHLVGLEGAEVTVTLNIEAQLPDDVSEHVVRTVTENGRELGFGPGSGFESG